MSVLRAGEFVLAAVLLACAWRAGAELFVAWYSGVEPPLSAGQRLWSWARVLTCGAAAVALAWPPPRG